MLPSANTCSYKGWKYFSNWKHCAGISWRELNCTEIKTGNLNGSFSILFWWFREILQIKCLIIPSVFFTLIVLFRTIGRGYFPHYAQQTTVVSKPAQSTFGCAFRKSLMLSGNDETKKWGGQNFSCRTCANISYRFSNDDKSKIWTLFGEAKPQTYRIITKLRIMTNYMASWTGKLSF